MRELGEVLRKRREAKGLSLDEVQAATKIRKRYLQAIEDGDWSILPGEVYARGFVRAYAEYLGLDGQELLERYYGHAQERQREAEDGPEEERPRAESADASHQDGARNRPVTAPPDETPARAVPSMPARSARRNRGHAVRGVLAGGLSGYGGQALVVLGILVVLGGGWYWLSQANRSAPPSPQQTVGETTPSAGGAANATSNRTSGNAVMPPAQNAVGNTVTNSIGNGTGSSSSATTVKVEPFQSPYQTYVVSTAAPTLSVEVQASGGPSWIAVTADGRPVVVSDFVQDGQTKTWQANQSLVLHVGRVSVLTVMINGQSVQLPPVSGAAYLRFVRSSQ